MIRVSLKERAREGGQTREKRSRTIYIYIYKRVRARAAQSLVPRAAENVITRIRGGRAAQGAKLRLRGSARITREYIRDDNCEFVGCARSLAACELHSYTRFFPLRGGFFFLSLFILHWYFGRSVDRSIDSSLQRLCETS